MDYNKITIDTYNKTAKEYAEKVKELVPMNELEKFVNYVPKGNILDIGCGSGVQARHLQERGLQVYGIDLSEKLIKLAKKESQNSFFNKMDMRELKFISGMFDGIWSVASLLHLEKKDVPLALSEAYRILKPEGIMYLSIKGGKGESLENDERYGNLPKYYSYYEPEEINGLLSEANFEVLENYPIQYDDIYRIAHPWYNIFAKKK
ncbi:class I SAM-dependent methyltransferase [archaeon]|nr:class I SAM-dependent methyltransferase [archaeon]